jgi:hypothetical protein
MGELRTLYGIAESCPFDAMLVRDMKRAVNSLLQLNLKRFRVPQKDITRYSALDVMKQALELLYEFSPSEKNYREAMRTILVYSEGDDEMLQTLRQSFVLIANAVYNAYAGQRHAESLAPKTLFLQGVPFDSTEFQQAFRFVGVKPPEISPPSVKKTIFLDESFEPYKQLLDGKFTEPQAEVGREEHWAQVIEAHLINNDGPSLIRAESKHIETPKFSLPGLFSRMNRGVTGRLPELLRKGGIRVEIVGRIADVNIAFGNS